MIVVGIDPGITGALAVIRSGRFEEVVDMPVLDSRTDGRMLFKYFCGWDVQSDEAIIYLEDQHAMPKNGSIGNFSMGYNFATVVTAAAAAGLSVRRVAPTKWMRAMSVTSKSKNPDGSRLLARELYPEACDQLNLKKHHGRAEAILIARYGHLQEVHQ